jgi:hypothetical protein
MKVPWLPKSDIDALAATVIDSCRRTFGRRIRPPIPVEAMIEQHFDLQLGYVDFKETYGMDGILGAMLVNRRTILASDRLLESRCEGRLNFTLAHEIGHWILHRHLVGAAHRFEAESGAIFCRAADGKKPVEWQADYFAACLLMPEDWMRAAYEAAFGKTPLVLNRVDSSCSGPLYREPCVRNWPYIASVVQQAGRLSNVSKHSIIIRLQELGMVINETACPLAWDPISV